MLKIDININEADCLDMSELFINQPNSWSNWWRGNQDAARATSSKGKVTAAE